jgi:Thermolysin metallopeptidase, alpha-helical domain/Thrombospondin type 3 repeat
MSDYVDGADVHINGGITNRAAFLMATVRGGIGKEKLAQLTFEVLTTSLPQAATFQDFACHLIADASLHERTSAYGFVPTDVGAIAAGFASVGLPASECDPLTAAAGADRDRDLWPDTDDNCPAASNLDQEDLDGDGPGDVCDPDPDGDGWCSPGLGALPPGTVGAAAGCTGSDNCPLMANADQRNDDGDRLGEVCDDDDLDFVFNTDDNCPQVPNRDQRDGDSDDIGDACDNDPDNDCVPSRGFPDVVRTCEAADIPGTCAASCLADPAFECTTGCTDNCPDVANVDQAESDGDRHGDACDLCQGMVNLSNADLDGDTLGDECDVDDDGDTVNDDTDVCPRVYDPLQARLPNGEGLACTDLDDILAAGQYLFDWRDLASDLRLQIPFVPCLVDGPGCFGWADADALTEVEVTLGQPLKGVLAYVVDDRGARIATLESTDKGFRGAFRPAADAHYLSPFKTDSAKLYEGTQYAVEFVLPAGLSAKSIELTLKLPTQ